MKGFWISVASIAVLVLIGAQHGHSQGTFQNLDFESPILPLVRDANFEVPISKAMPGWSGYVGGAPVGTVVYNTVSLGAPAVNLQGPGSMIRPAIQGSYTVGLQTSFPNGQFTAAIGQTGLDSTG